MKISVWMFAVAGLAIALPAQAQVPAVSRATAPSAIGTAVSDTELLIYRFTGARDDGGGTGSGVATIVHCTNFSGSAETVRFAARNFDSTLVANRTFTIGPTSLSP
jgi:hypothetical protein